MKIVVFCGKGDSDRRVNKALEEIESLGYVCDVIVDDGLRKGGK